MRTVSLGSQGLTVSQLGFGCMGLTTGYGPKLSDDKSIALLQKTVHLGITLWDTANLYVFFDPWRLLHLSSPVVCQEEILGRALQRIARDKVRLASKTGVLLKLFPKLSVTPTGAPAFVRQQCLDSLRRLGTHYLDLFYLHRIDQHTPIEVTMTEMKKLVTEGKVRYVGLSECSAATIRRAHAIQPLSCVQLEYSLWSRGIEEEILPTCAELGIGLVAYSPLGRGFLAGAVREEKKDYRGGQERMVGEALQHNAKMLDKVQGIAESKGVSLAQLALAWVEAQAHRLGGAGLVAIPGTTKEENLVSNVQSTGIELSVEEIQALEEAVPVGEVKGGRYEEGHCTWEVDENRELTEDEATELGIER